mgnify:FL=1
MGYRSDVVIAVHKQVLAMDLINPVIPEILKQQEFTDIEGTRYWHIDQWKWYSDYPEIRSIENMFSTLEKLAEENNLSLFGAIRLGEEFGDHEEWGDPYEYGIQLNQSIERPMY